MASSLPKDKAFLTVAGQDRQYHMGIRSQSCRQMDLYSSQLEGTWTSLLTILTLFP